MDNQKIEENNILTANQMVGELLLSLVIYGGIFAVLYRIIYALTYKYFTENEHYALLAFFVIGLQALMIFTTFKLGNKRVIKKGTIYKEDVSKVIKNISFVIIALLLIQVFSVFSSVETTINEVIEEDFWWQYSETVLPYLYDENEMEIYHAEKEKIIKEVKDKMYQYLAIVEIGICTIYISAIFLEKRYLYTEAI